MTTIISRLYEDANTADAVAAELEAAGFPAANYDVIRQTGEESVLERLEEAQVDDASAQAYAQHMTSDRALVVVRAGFNPFGAALKAMQICNGHSAVDAGAPNPDRYVRVEPPREARLKVIRGGRLFLTQEYDPKARKRGFFSANFGFPMLKPRKPSNSIIRGGRPMSSGFYPWGLLVRQERPLSVSKNSGPIFSRIFNWPTLTSARMR